ncbi:hypothetical protein J4421_04890 [Candidatus Woesearchaeota archaeon]|nr:hypothetical protein [Candidatus Woesearchaeota archaeon]
MVFLKELLTYSLIAVSLAGYGIIDSKLAWINENSQRIQEHSERVCLTQVGDTHYFMETFQVNEKESIDLVCERGDRAAKLIITYVPKSDLEKMNCDPEEDTLNQKIITSTEFLNYFLSKTFKN